MQIETNDVITRAVLYLAGVCDGAQAHDNVGFNGTDTDFGHSLANGIKQYGSLTDNQRASAWRMLQKYRGQLSRAGITLPNPNNGVPPKPSNGTYTSVASPKHDPEPKRNTGQIKVVSETEIAFILPSYLSRETFNDMLNLFKVTVPRGRRFVSATEGWFVDRSIPGVVERLRSAFPGFEVDSALLPPPVNGDLPEFECKELPDGRKPFAHQIFGARFGLKWAQANHGCIIADQMGLGKTLTGLLIAKALGYRIIVIAPKSVRLNWLKEAEGVGVEIEVHSWAKVPLAPEFTKYVVLADEAHYAQSMKSQRTQRFLALALHPNCVACYPLTGTPIKNGRPINIFPLLMAIKHPLSQSRRFFEERYCGAKSTQFSKWDTTGATHLNELHEKLKPVLLLRKKEDCLDLPAKVRVFKEAEVGTEDKKAYQIKFDSLRAEYHARLMSGEIRGEGEALVLLTHLRHATSVAKVSDTVSLALDAIEEGQQVVVFTEFKDSAQQIANQLGVSVLDGDTPMVERQAMVDRFQSGQVRAFVGTIRAGGVGITLTKGTIEFLVDRPWTPGDALQAEDRIHRIGQTQSVTCIWMQYGPMDEKTDSTLAAKMANIGSVLDGKADELTGISYMQLAQEVFAA